MDRRCSCSVLFSGTFTKSTRESLVLVAEVEYEMGSQVAHQAGGDSCVRFRDDVA